jgi:hypothetical protein
MLRNRIVNGQKASDATYTAHANLVRGMGVVKGVAGATAFVDETKDAGVFLVDRDNLPKGIECAYTDRPDKAFDNIEQNDKVILRPYVIGESFYTDQYAEGAVVDGTMLGVGEDGKWVAYEGGTKFVSRGVETVAGLKMLAVEVIA